MFVENMENNDDWLSSNKTWKKWNRIIVGELLSYAGVDFKKPIDKERLVKEFKRRKKLKDMKLDNNRKQATQKRSIKHPKHLKQVENSPKWKEFTNLKPWTYMTYKCREYGEKDGHKLMNAIISQKKSYNNEQERKRMKKTKEMNSKCLLGGVETSISHEMNNVNEVMASNTQVTQEHNNNNYEFCIDSNDISKENEFKKPNNNIDNYVEENRWEYSNECNKWEVGGLSGN
jgi:hypothetical protein